VEEGDESKSSKNETAWKGKILKEEAKKECGSQVYEDIGTERQERDAFPGRRTSEEEKEYFYEGKTKSKQEERR